mgnify:CR=1 FL=1
MYYVSKRMEIACAHHLNLPYLSKCSHLHGHNYIVTVHCSAEKLTDYGMVVDFAKIKEAIHNYLDHSYLNDKLPDINNPTAENMARWICDTVNEICGTGRCYKVEVQESEGNVATYIEPSDIKNLYNSDRTKRYVTWQEVDDYIDHLCDRLKDSSYSCVYGIPRGGSIFAVMISHRLGIPVASELKDNCIIVDDVSDSGSTLSKHVASDKIHKYYSTTMHTKQSTEFIPDYFESTESDDTWIIYPWEVKE